MAAKDPSIRRLIGRVGGNTSWRATDDRPARTAPARQAAFERFERQVDPDGTMDPAERSHRALSAQKAHMARMTLKAVQARKAKAAGKAKPDAEGGAAA